MSSSPRFRVVLGGLFSALVGSCILPEPRGAESVLHAYREALAAGDAARAHRLLTSAERRALSEPALRAALREDGREARELATRLARAGKPRVFAIVTLEDGTEVLLERGPNGFRLRDPLTRFYAQSSPRAALISFVRAVERERWDIVLRLMPAADRAGVELAQLGRELSARREELARLVTLLWAARDQPIEIVGDRATMTYAESFTARFVREEGLWRLESPE